MTLFNGLASNGLTSTALGNIIISLAAPLVVFIVTLYVNEQIQKHFKPEQKKGSGGRTKRRQDEPSYETSSSEENDIKGGDEELLMLK